jgi:hypothetical protein
MLCAAGLLCSVASGADDETLRSRVDDLVRRLDAATRAERSEAERSLIELGPPALPLLPTEPRTTGHPLNRVRRTLDARRQAELLAPAVFPVPGTEEAANLEALFGRLQARFGDDFDASAVPAANRALEWSPPAPLAFWDIVSRLERDRPLVARFDAVERDGRTFERWRLTPREKGDTRVNLVPAGTFAIRVSRETAADASGKVRLGLQVLSQPGVRGLLTFVNARNFKSTTAHGGSRSPTTPEARYELPWTSAGQSPRLLLEFGPPEAVATTALVRADRWAGECEVIAAAGEDRFRFDEALAAKPSRPVVQRIGRTTTSVERPELEARPDGMRARFVVLTTRHAEIAETTHAGERIVPVVALESHQFGLVPHSARLVSRTTGRELLPASTVRAEFFAAGTTRAEYMFEAVPAPAGDWFLECATVAVIGRERVRFAADDVRSGDAGPAK